MGSVSKFFLFLFLSLLFYVFSLFSKNYLASLFNLSETSVSQNGVTFIGPRFLDQYAVENLAKRPFSGADFLVGEKIKETDRFRSHLFSFKTKGKKVSGLMNIPKTGGKRPVVLLIRGYIDPKIYQTGMGTSRAAEIFAESGYVTLAPDFLGYGGSDFPSVNQLEERFQTYTTLLDLYGLVSGQSGQVNRLPESRDLTPGVEVVGVEIDSDRIYLWAHSNGGQIALIFLEAAGKNIPTTLWAPVSKPFPYSILFFSDEMADGGKSLRHLVAEFESRYEAGKFSLTEYLNLINSPLQLHQGVGDKAVPREWSEELVGKLRRINKDVGYFEYAGSGHNLEGHWDEAVKRDLEFFNSH